MLRALRAALPHESFVYVADSGHAPYGDQSTEFLEARAREVAEFLTGRRTKAMVLACNTVSVVAAPTLRSLHALPIVAMEPAIKPAVASTRSRVVLVLGTTATVRSESVARLCAQFGAQARIVLQACPGLVECVERGATGTHETRELLAGYLRPGLEADADTIVLGCTHYAFPRQLARRLGEIAATPTSQAARPTVFYTSGDPARLRSFLDAVQEPYSAIHVLHPPT